MSTKKSPSTINLLSSNNKVDCSRPYVKNILNSDHVPVFFNIHTDTLIKLQCNTLKLNNMLNPIMSMIHNSKLTTDLIDETIHSLTTATTRAADESIPINRSKYGVFITEEIQDAINKRNYHKRRWLRNHRTFDKDNYNKYNK